MIRWLQRTFNRLRYLRPNQFVVTVDSARMRISIEEPRGWVGISEPDLVLLDEVLAAGSINRPPRMREMA